MKKRVVLVGVVLGVGTVVGCTNAMAGDAAESNVGYENLERMVVTGTRMSELAMDLPYLVETLSEADLRNRVMAATVPEALLQSPSVLVQQTGRGQGSPYLRGFTGFRTLALVDGIRLNNSTFRDGPNQYWSTIDALAIDRLEIMQGPAGVVHGSDAIGGTVNALLSPIRYGNPGEHTLFGGAHYRGGIADSANLGRIQFGESVGGQWGYSLGLSGKSFGDVRAGDAVGTQANTGYNQWDADLKGQVNVGEQTRVTVAYQRTEQADVNRTHRTIYGIDWEGLSRGSDRRHSFDQLRELVYSRLETGTDRGDQFVATLSWQVQDEVRVVQKKDGSWQQDSVDVGTMGLALDGGSPSPVGRISYGLEHYHDHVNSGAIRTSAGGTITGIGIQGPVADDSAYDLFGAYAEDRIELPGRLEVSVGGRFTWARADAGRVQDPTSKAETSFSDSWDSVVGNARVMWHADEAQEIGMFTGVAQGFRAPNLSDLTRFDIARSGELETPSPGLSPEKFVSAEIGMKVEKSSWTGSLSYYRTFILDMIVSTPTGQVVSGLTEVVKQNGAEGWVEGVQLDLDYRLTDDVSIFGGGAWQQGENDHYPGVGAAKVRVPMTRCAPLTGLAGVRWTPASLVSGLTVELFGQFAARQDKLSPADAADTQRIPPGGTPGWMTANLRVGYAWSSRLRTTVAFENWFDETYRIHGSGINQGGRNLRGSIDFRF